ncbi:MAG TPA: POTRA domain-containing protein, partial [Sorangium sp.]|nr:POTRA domain-containing protein [Sorangium sp.]
MLRLPGRWLRLVWLGLFLVFVAAVARPRLAAAQVPGGAPDPQQPGGDATPPPAPAGAAAPAAPAAAAGGAQPGAGGTPVQGAAAAAEPTLDLAPTEAELARGQPVAQVVVAGNRRVSTEDVLVYLGQTRVGRPFTPEGLARDVRELWESGLFDDVEVDLTR